MSELLPFDDKVELLGCHESLNGSLAGADPKVWARMLRM